MTATLSPAMPSLGQVRGGGLGWRQAQVGEVIAQHPVVLFRHGPVVASQARLDMHEGRLGGVGGQRSGQHRIGVSLHDHRPGRIVSEQAGQAGGGFPDLDSPWLPAHLQKVGRPGQIESSKEHRGEIGVIVLPGVDHPGGGAQEPDDVGQLDDFRAGAEHHRHRAGRKILTHQPLGRSIPVRAVRTPRGPSTCPAP